MHRKTEALLLHREHLHWKVCCSFATLLAEEYICFGGSQVKNVNFQGFLSMGSHISDYFQVVLLHKETLAIICFL